MEHLVEQLRELQQRFLRINSDDPKQAEREIRAAEIVGMKLLWQLEQAGLVSLEGLKKPTPSKSMVPDENEYSGQWSTCMMLIPRAYPDELPADLLGFHSRKIESSGCESLTVGETKGADWRIRSENYAKVCGLLARELESDTDTPQKKGQPQPPLETYVTLSMMGAIVQKSNDTIERLWKKKRVLPPPDIKGGNGKANEWKWNSVRPILEKEFNRTLSDEYPSIQIVRS